MVDYYPLRYNHKHPDPANGADEGEEEEGLEPVVVDVVYNVHEKAGNSKTIALKVSFRLPVKS